MDLKTGSFYEFGEFRLEPAEQLLTSNGRPIPLAPKAFDLLVFLVQNNGRLVTRDQIMQAVWAGSFVEEANLTVTVSILRRALGGRDGGSQHIETIPKKGYRFVAPVTVVAGGAASVPALERATRAPTPEPPRDPSEPIEMVKEPPVAAGPPAEGDAESPRARAGGPAAHGARLRKFIVIPALGLLVMALGVVAYFRIAPPAPVTPTQPTRSLAILPLQNLAQDPGTDYLSLSLADALITKLDYVGSLSVRPSSAVEKYRGKPIDIRAIAVDLRVDTLLTGTFVRDGDNLRVTYQLVDVEGEKLLGRGAIDLRYDNLLHVQDAVAAQIIRKLAVKLSPAEASRLNSATPVSSPLAYEYYLRGVDLHGQHKFPMAIKMLEKSTEIDPDYALAWAYLGASYTSDAAFELGGREQYRRAQAAYERALELEPAQLDAQMFLANLLIDTGRVEQAMPLLRRALQANTNYAPLHWELGYAYRFAGLLRESIAECERALQLDPSVKSNGSVLNAYLYSGEYAKFLGSLPETEDSAFLLFYRGFGEYYRKEWQRAASDFDRAFALDSSLYTRVGKALSHAIVHRQAEGLEMLRGLEKGIAQRGVGDPEGTYKLAQGFAALGDSAAALRVLRASVEGGFFPYPYIARDPLLDPLRNEPEFAQILGIAERRYQTFREQFF